MTKRNNKEIQYSFKKKKKICMCTPTPLSLLLIRSCIFIWNSVSFHLKKRIEIRPVVTGKTKINKPKRRKKRYVAFRSLTWEQKLSIRVWRQRAPAILYLPEIGKAIPRPKSRFATSNLHNILCDLCHFVLYLSY